MITKPLIIASPRPFLRLRNNIDLCAVLDPALCCFSFSFFSHFLLVARSRYSEWLKLHPEHLTAMFTFLMEGFASPEVMPAAATAIKVS